MTHTYYGTNIYPADSNSAGIRYYCRTDSCDVLRADTLDGIRALIRADRVARSLPVRST